MNKAHVTHLLSDYVEGGLPHGGAEKVKAHLSFCNACRQALSDVEHNREKLKATPLARVPAGLEGRVLTAIQEERARPLAVPHARTSGWPSWLSPMGALALIAVCGAAFAVVRYGPTDLFARRPSAPTPATPVATEAGTPTEPVVSESTTTDLSTATVASVPAEVPTDGPLAEVSPAEKIDKPVSSETHVPEPTVQPGLTPGAIVPLPGARPPASGATVPRPAPAAALATPASTPPTASATLPQLGNRSLIESPLETLISTPEAWQTLWDRHTGGGQPVPAVDFSTQEVIAIFAGQQPTGGYGLEIVEIKDSSWNGDPARMVRYKVTLPPSGAVTPQVLTSPYLLRAEPRFEGQTFFEKIP